MLLKRGTPWLLPLLCMATLTSVILNVIRLETHSVSLDFRTAAYRKQPTILVTGGMGNIGKYVVRDLLGMGYKVLCLDVQDMREDLNFLLGEKKMDSSLLDGPNFYYHKGDVRDVNATVEVLWNEAQQLKGIIHLAAISRVAFCLDNEVDCWDVNTRGTASLLDSVARYLAIKNGGGSSKGPSISRNSRPWMIFASSREVYGQNCYVNSPCNEESPPDPLNLYGKTKWEGEKQIRSHAGKVLGDYIVLRLASVYGGIFDLPERLIPSLVIKSMTKGTIDLNGGDQVFDFVHIDDVVGSILKTVGRLEASASQDRQGMPRDIHPDGGGGKYLICSGQTTTALQIIQYLEEILHSSTPLRMAPADTRYPSSFVCDNLKMRTDLNHTPLYRNTRDGLQHYLGLMYKRNLDILEARHTMHCTSTLGTRKFDPQLLQNCSVYVTAFNQGPDYLKHLSYPEPTRKRRVGNGVVLRDCPSNADKPRDDCFLLEYEGGVEDFRHRYVSYENKSVHLQADYDTTSGGYTLLGRTSSTDGDVILKNGFEFERQTISTTSALLLSIWPYSCPPHPATGKARLPTPIFEPTLYLLHEIVPPEGGLPSEGSQPLFCRRIEAAIEFAQRKMNEFLVEMPQNVTDETTALYFTPDPGHGHAVCDSDCDVIGGCVDTGRCRCINPYCGPNLKPESRSPFRAWAYTNDTSFEPSGNSTEKIREMILGLPYPTVLTGPTATLANDWVPPKIHLMDVNFPRLAGKALDDEATTITQIPYGSCFVADHFHRISLQGLNTSLDEADFMFVPFYGGWLRHYARMEDSDIAGILNGLLQQAHDLRASVARTQHGKSIHIVIPLTHDYGGALNFSYDMRDFRGKSLPQQPLLQNVTVLSPLGDFNTLAYLPEKDIVIPPASCKTPLLLETFKDVSFVRRASDRQFLLYFGGSADHRTGSAVRNAILAGNLFPRSKIEISTAQDNDKYLQQLNNSIFCPHIFGTTGWATRLSDTIYAGCIPILTSDVTHPPYWDILDWAKFSVYVDWRHLEDIEDVLKSFSFVEIERKQAWLLKVRDAFVYDPGAIEEESHGMGRKGPIFHTLLSLKTGALRQNTG